MVLWLALAAEGWGSDDGAVLDALRASSAVAPRIRFEEGFPRFLAVDVRVDGRDAVDRTFVYLDRFGALYSLVDPASELVVDRVDEADGLSHVRLVQLHHGIPVDRGELVVHLAGDRVLGTNGHLVRHLGPVANGPIDASEAVDLALRQVGPNTSPPTTGTRHTRRVTGPLRPSSRITRLLAGAARCTSGSTTRWGRVASCRSTKRRSGG